MDYYNKGLGWEQWLAQSGLERSEQAYALFVSGAKLGKDYTDATGTYTAPQEVMPNPLNNPVGRSAYEEIRISQGLPYTQEGVELYNNLINEGINPTEAGITALQTEQIFEQNLSNFEEVKHDSVAIQFSQSLNENTDLKNLKAVTSKLTPIALALGLVYLFKKR